MPDDPDEEQMPGPEELTLQEQMQAFVGAFKAFGPAVNTAASSVAAMQRALFNPSRSASPIPPTPSRGPRPGPAFDRRGKKRH